MKNTIHILPMPMPSNPTCSNTFAQMLFPSPATAELRELVKQARTLPDLIIIYADYDYDSGTEYISKASHTMISQLLSMIKMEGSSYVIKEYHKYNNIPKMITDWNRSGDYVAFCGTQDELNAIESEKERQAIEHSAAEFASECGFSVGTPDYIRALTKAMDKLNAENEMIFSGESKMERWAACRFAGCSDSYWSDEDYISTKQNSKLEYLNRIYTWIENNCPLLMAKLNSEEMQELT